MLRSVRDCIRNSVHRAISCDLALSQVEFGVPVIIKENDCKTKSTCLLQFESGNLCESSRYGRLNDTFVLMSLNVAIDETGQLSFG